MLLKQPTYPHLLRHPAPRYSLLLLLPTLFFLLLPPLPSSPPAPLLNLNTPHLHQIKSLLTIGIKTYACDQSIIRLLSGLVHSIRIVYPSVTILIANDGPLSLSSFPFLSTDSSITEIRLPIDAGISRGRNQLVKHTTTPFFLLLDDDHIFDIDTDVWPILSSMLHSKWDVVGLRVRHLPGIAELEDINVLIPRYVANITSFEARTLTLCVWDENAGPSVQQMSQPISAHVLHNAFIARTSILRQYPWRDELKVNEHMSFFLDLWKNDVTIGYLPSVYVHHRVRMSSICYQQKRGREEHYQRLLQYDSSFQWTEGCYHRWVTNVMRHIGELEAYQYN